jgi:hypothetical protein
MIRGGGLIIISSVLYIPVFFSLFQFYYTMYSYLHIQYILNSDLCQGVDHVSFFFWLRHNCHTESQRRPP